MSDFSDFDRAQEIIREECDLIQEHLFRQVKIRVAEEIGKHIKIVRHKRPYPYSVRSGPKQLSPYTVDIDMHQRSMVLPICNIEGKVP